MSILILCVIYSVLFSIGVPHGLLGVAWPQMRLELIQPLEALGTANAIQTLAMMLTAIVAGHLAKRIKVSKIIMTSCVLIAAASLGQAATHSMGVLALTMVPFGIGVGFIDSLVNNYVALNYETRHMSWLHCFWGLGALLGPQIMTASMINSTWRTGFVWIAAISLLAGAGVALTMKRWKDVPAAPARGAPAEKVLGDGLAWLSILFVLAICGMESTISVWLNTLLVEGRGIDVTTAGLFISAFFGSMTAARFLLGFFARRFSNAAIIRAVLILALVGAVMLAFPVGALTLPAIIVMGMAIGPVIPCMFSETPRRFGEAKSGVLIGYQLSAAYLSGVVIVPAIGLAARASLEAVPVCLAALAAASILLFECVERIAKKRNSAGA